jgi:hypothetical protein
VLAGQEGVGKGGVARCWAKGCEKGTKLGEGVGKGDIGPGARGCWEGGVARYWARGCGKET